VLVLYTVEVVYDVVDGEEVAIPPPVEVDDPVPETVGLDEAVPLTLDDPETVALELEEGVLTTPPPLDVADPDPETVDEVLTIPVPEEVGTLPLDVGVNDPLPLLVTDTLLKVLELLLKGVDEVLKVPFELVPLENGGGVVDEYGEIVLEVVFLVQTDFLVEVEELLFV
jgi:hypothetical protein